MIVTQALRRFRFKTNRLKHNYVTLRSVCVRVCDFGCHNFVFPTNRNRSKRQSEFLAIFCNLIKAQEQLRVQCAIGFDSVFLFIKQTYLIFVWLNINETNKL